MLDIKKPGYEYQGQKAEYCCHPAYVWFRPMPVGQGIVVTAPSVSPAVYFSKKSLPMLSFGIYVKKYR